MVWTIIRDINKALALIDMGEIEPASALVERTLALEPDFAQAHLQRRIADAMA